MAFSGRKKARLQEEKGDIYQCIVDKWNFVLNNDNGINNNVLNVLLSHYCVPFSIVFVWNDCVENIGLIVISWYWHFDIDRSDK